MMDQASDPEIQSGMEVVARAREWIGTPYRHQASCKGAGTDCLGLLRGLWREMLGDEPEEIPAYSPDWSEATGDEALLKAAARNLKAVDLSSIISGDILIMRMGDSSVAKHIGIMAVSVEDYPTMIHAYSGHGVVESPMTRAWVRRIAGAFRFPDRSS